MSLCVLREDKQCAWGAFGKSRANEVRLAADRNRRKKSHEQLFPSLFPLLLFQNLTMSCYRFPSFLPFLSPFLPFRQTMEVLTMDSVLNALAPAERRGLGGEGGREVLREAGRIAAMQGQFISFSVGGGRGGREGGRGRGRAESQEEALERALARLQFGK